MLVTSTVNATSAQRNDIYVRLRNILKRIMRYHRHQHSTAINIMADDNGTYLN